MFYRENNVMTQRPTNFCSHFYKALQDLSKELRVPISILINRALNNEFQKNKPFEQDLSLPLPSDDISNDDSQNLFEFIKKNPGLCLEHLVFLREVAGIVNKDDLLAAYALLLHNRVIEEYKPEHSKFNHPEHYRVIRVPRGNKTVSRVGGSYKKIKSTLKNRSILDEIDEN